MKKILKINNLDCADCAAKIEHGLKKIDGVLEANVNFMMQKLTLTADDDKMEDILIQVEKTIKSIEPDCSIS